MLQKDPNTKRKGMGRENKLRKGKCRERAWEKSMEDKKTVESFS